MFPFSKPDEHLVCYVRSGAVVSDIPATAVDQFGMWNLNLYSARLLCVPSFKDEVVQTEEGTWGEIKSFYR